MGQEFLSVDNPPSIAPSFRSGKTEPFKLRASALHKDVCAGLAKGIPAGKAPIILASFNPRPEDQARDEIVFIVLSKAQVDTIARKDILAKFSPSFEMNFTFTSESKAEVNFF